MPLAPKIITLKAASLRLGVHPQTIRSWERRGLIRLVHLPGSGYRRVSEAEVERLRAALDSSAATAQRVRILRPPAGDAGALRAARKLARQVQSELALALPRATLDETMQRLRGRSWSS